MLIRRESPDDYKQIYDLVKMAFQTAKVSNGEEQNYVEQLRGSDSYIPELALVIENNGELIGHIMLTKTYITDNDNQFEALLLAPISIAFSHQNKGFGSSLIRESFKIAKELGFTAVFLVGDPDYYSRFGFTETVRFDIKNTNNIPDKNVMACELVKDALLNVRGTISF